MDPTFSLTPAEYGAESQRSSRLWKMWLPIAAFVIIPILPHIDAEMFEKWFASESTGILEFLHAFLPLLTALIGLRLLFSNFVRSDPALVLWCASMFVGGIYLAGEEASWGQHYVGWVTPGGWSQVNDQQETNLHNISNLLDQLPRALLQAGIVIGGIIYPWLILKHPGLLLKRFNFTYPPLALLPLAVLTALCWIYRLFDKFDPDDNYVLYRSGEFQELFIVWFLFYYALFLLRRDRQMRARMKSA